MSTAPLASRTQDFDELIRVNPRADSYEGVWAGWHQGDFMSDAVVSTESRRRGTVCPLTKQCRSTSPCGLDSNNLGASLVTESVKNPPALQEMRVRFLGLEDPLEKEMAIHSRVLAWTIPWTEEPGRLQSMG